MYEYVKNGNSLNKIIESVLNTSNNKQKLGITGYLTNELYTREIVDSQAVISSFIPIIYSYERQVLNEKIKMLINSK